MRRGSAFLIGLSAAAAGLLLATAATVPELRWPALALALVSLLIAWSQLLVRRGHAPEDRPPGARRGGP